MDKGELPSAGVCLLLLCAPLAATIILCTHLLPSHGAKTLPPAPSPFHRNRSIKGLMKHEFCLHPVVFKPSQNQQLSANIFHVVMVQDTNQFHPPVAESLACLSSGTLCVTASLSEEIYIFCHYFASWLLGSKLSGKLHFSPPIYFTHLIRLQHFMVFSVGSKKNV